MLLTDELKKLFLQSVDHNAHVRESALHMLAKAFELPLREAVLPGDIISDIYDTVRFAPGVSIEYPLDPIAPGSEDRIAAYIIPHEGRLPNRVYEGDYMTIPTFPIGNDVSWNLKYQRDARWDVVTRLMKILSQGFVMSANDSGWHLLIAAGVDRNIRVNDANATAGQFTKRLISLMQTVMIRNGGGNSSSDNQTILTDLYVSDEAMEDVRNWNIDQIDEVTRREILVREGTRAISRLFGVNIHPIRELGVDQKYQLFYTNTLSGTMATSDEEIVVGVSKTRKSLIRAMREDLTIHNDPTAHRSNMVSYYGRMEHGFGSLDGRDVIIGSY